MIQLQISCFKCNQALELGTTVGFKECCHKCDADLHCCKNCHFYDLNSYNGCRESQADRVVDKDKANFCDYFRIGSGGGKSATLNIDSKVKVRSSLDDLFKK